MKNKYNIIGIILFTAFFASCGNGNDKADGYGNFEATETTVAAETNGKLLAFTINEGDDLEQNAYVGYIDTTQLHLKREQLLASKNVVEAKSAGVLSQVNVLNAQLKTILINKRRIDNLIKEKAATQKQLDDINGQIDVIKQQIRSIEIQNSSVFNELKSLDAQLKQIEDQIKKSVILSPLAGKVLAKYVEPFEVVSFGKPLYKIADLSNMQLRVYVSETQLTGIKVGQKVIVKVDENKGMRSYSGMITWISSEAEFTPKIIQTKEERVNLVYAVKIDVKNDGSLKIGMPAEMWISGTSN